MARIGPTIALTSLTIVASELILTRIFSVVPWSHFAFFAISVALFGLGVAALAVHFFQHRLPEAHTDRHLALGAMGQALALVVVDFALSRFSPDWFGGVFTELTFKLVLLFLLAALPFLAAGFVVALGMSRAAKTAHSLYAWDLLGAGLGCALTVPLLSLFGGPKALVAVAALALGSALIACKGRGVRGAALVGWLILGALWLTGAETKLFQVRVAKGIDLAQVEPELTRWNAFSMVSVLPSTGFRGWGLSPLYNGPIPDQKTLVIDMNAATTLTKFSGDFTAVRNVAFDLSAFVYRVRPDAPRVCVIGAGGGKDVLAALMSGAGHVTAVEVNPLIVNDVMRGSYREFTGDLYGRPDVTAVAADGRAFVRRAGPGSWNVVHLSMVDTSAASAAGAYALTENGLYTQEAFEDFFSALTDDGLLSVSSVSLPELAVGPRLATVARAALLHRGADPAASLAVVQTPWLGRPNAIMTTLIAAPRGLPPALSARVVQQAKALGFYVVYVPGGGMPAVSGEQRTIDRVATAKDDAALGKELAALPLDVSATTDDHPFFFYQNRLSDLPHALTAKGPAHLFGNGLVILAKVALVALVMVLLFLVLPVVLRARARADDAPGAGYDLGYVACLGIGFMFVEIALLYRLSVYLGEPTATLSVVLFSLLVLGGIGSRVLAGPTTAAPRRLRFVLGGVVLLVLLAAFGLPSVLEAGRAFSATGRAALAVLLIAPVGFLLGAPLPTALVSVASRAPHRIPWLWSVNGATSVLGSILATLTALHGGLRLTLVVGAVAYAAAALLSLRVVTRQERA